MKNERKKSHIFVIFPDIFFKSTSTHYLREARIVFSILNRENPFFSIIRPPPLFHENVSKRETKLKNVKLNLQPFTFRERSRLKKKSDVDPM